VKFSFLGIDVAIKKRHVKDLLSLNDINHINNELLLYLKNLNEDEINKRIQDVTCTVSQGVKKIKETLSNKGIVIIPDFIPENSINKISQDLSLIREKLLVFESSGVSFKDEANVLFQQGNFKIKDYNSLANYNKAVATIRDGQDMGMIDIFNADKWCHSIGDALRPYFNDELFTEVMKDNNNNSPKAKNLNLYMNNGVTKTRGFHVDSYRRQLKGFVYLEDCLDLKCGPYTYVKESHINSSFVKINKKISSALPNETETPIVLRCNIVPALAKKGTMVISDQGGSHRGFPQIKDFQRTVAVMNFS
jgi:hypothetical protein